MLVTHVACDLNVKTCPDSSHDSVFFQALEQCEKGMSEDVNDMSHPEGF